MTEKNFLLILADGHVRAHRFDEAWAALAEYANAAPPAQQRDAAQQLRNLDDIVQWRDTTRPNSAPRRAQAPRPS